MDGRPRGRRQRRLERPRHLDHDINEDAVSHGDRQGHDEQGHEVSGPSGPAREIVASYPNPSGSHSTSNAALPSAAFHICGSRSPALRETNGVVSHKWIGGSVVDFELLPFQLLIAALGGWLQREQADVIAFLRSEWSAETTTNATTGGYWRTPVTSIDQRVRYFR